MPTYAVVNGENPGPLQHPAVTLVGPDGEPWDASENIPAGTYVPSNVSGLVINDIAAAAANTTAINAALTAAGTAALAANGAGETVRLPAGKIYIAGRITVPLYVDLLGAGKWVTQLRCTDAASQVRFGDGGGTTLVENYGGRSGDFRIYGANLATCPLFIGLSVAREFESIWVSHAAGDGVRLEQTQNCTLLGVDSQLNAGSGIVLDYGAGGNAIYKGEYARCGYANGRTTYTGPNTGGGYTYVRHNLFSHCLFEGTTATTVACFDQGSGTRNIFDSCHFTLFSGASGHAALFGTDIPVYRQWKEHADAAALSGSAYFTGGCNLFGSAPVSGTAYKGIGMDIQNPSGVDGFRNVYIGQGTLISIVSTGIKAADTSSIEAETFTIDTYTARFAPQSGGTATEGVIIKRRGNAQEFTGVDPATRIISGRAAVSQTADLLTLFASDGTTPLFRATSGGTVIATGQGSFAGALTATIAQLSTRGLVGTPAFTFTNDLDCGMWSPGTNLLAFSTAGAERMRFGAAGETGFFGSAGTAKPTVTGSRGGNAALASLLTALAGLGLLTDSSSA